MEASKQKEELRACKEGRFCERKVVRERYIEELTYIEFRGEEKRNVVTSHQEDSIGKTQPTYSKEFKQQTVTLFKTSGKSKIQIARDLGISDSALSKWCKEFEEQDQEVFPGKGHQIPV